jgi:hypothetical protein
LSVKNKTRTIGGREFTCVQFMAVRSYTLLHTLLQEVGPLIAGSLSNTLSVRELVPMIVDLLSKLTPERSLELMVSILEGTIVTDGKNMVSLDSTERFDVMFGPNIGDMFKALAFSIEVNYGDFLSAALAKMGEDEDEGAAEKASEIPASS